MNTLTQNDRDAALSELTEQGWALAQDRDAITKTFRFGDFARAFEWMSSVAALCEKMNHHPEWANSFNRVCVTLTTHDTGGLSEKDFRLARLMEELSYER